MTDALHGVQTLHTPQTRQVPGVDQATNAAGGYGFTIDGRTRLRRFLILGTDGGTYYAGERELTAENAGFLIELARTDPNLIIDEAVAVSVDGRAPRNDQSLFALAVVAAFADDDGKARALAELPRVARTAAHLFAFVTYSRQFRGWGRALTRAVAEWYTAKPVDQLAYQMVKYRNRCGWTHRDVLRVAHPHTDDAELNGLFAWAVRGDTRRVPQIVRDFTEAAGNSGYPSAVAQVVDASDLPWEGIPVGVLGDPHIWRSLLRRDRLPLGALLRNLGRMTASGVFENAPELTDLAATRIINRKRLTGARVHPLAVLNHLRTYRGGRQAFGNTRWTPIPAFIDALDEAFYLTFDNVEPTGKRHLLALDVSGSMACSTIGGTALTPRDAATALAMVTIATERATNVHTVAFSDHLKPLALSRRQRLDDAVAVTSALPFGATDCALPMQYAAAHRIAVDVFHIYTDNETWWGDVHPFQALREYRRVMGIEAKLAVVGMTATDFSIADPRDRGMLDVVGFDTATPTLLSDFAIGL